MAEQESTNKELNHQMGITTDGSQFLTFQLGEELYGVDILRVQEIKGIRQSPVSPTPGSHQGRLESAWHHRPDCRARTKFGMPTIEHTMFTVIVVGRQRENHGLVVDAVSDARISIRKIFSRPRSSAPRLMSVFNGIGKAGDKLVALLDMDRLLTDGDMTETEKIAA